MIGRRAPVVAILLVAATVRFWGIGFGLPHTEARPDESVVIGIAVGFFNGDLHPHFFDYPTLFMYVLAGLYLVYFLAGRMVGTFHSLADFTASLGSDWTPFYLIDRGFSALLGTVTVLVVYRLAARIAGIRCGQIAAVLLALSFLHARDSHFGVTDVGVTLLIYASLLALVHAHLDRLPRHFFLAGMLAGLATSTKYNAVLLIVPLLISQGLEILDARREGRPLFRDRRLWLFLAPCFAGFLFGTPYAFVDRAGLLGGLQRVSSHFQTGHGDAGTGWVAHFAVSLRYGVGWAVLAAALPGFVVIARRSPRMAAILCSFPIVYYIAAGPGRTVFVRYMIPVLPCLCILAAIAVDAAARGLSTRVRLSPRMAGALTASVTALIVFPSASNLVQLDRLLARPDNRLMATKWIRDRVPAGASLYQSGAVFGALELGVSGNRPPFELWDFDEGRGLFTIGSETQTRDPDWIVLQEFPLQYSRVPPAIAALAASDRYVRVESFLAFDPEADQGVFDIQDAFFLPLSGFRGVLRPGPNFDVYQRRTRAADR